MYSSAVQKNNKGGVTAVVLIEAMGRKVNPKMVATFFGGLTVLGNSLRLRCSCKRAVKIWDGKSSPTLGDLEPRLTTSRHYHYYYVRVSRSAS